MIIRKGCRDREIGMCKMLVHTQLLGEAKIAFFLI